MTTGTNKRIVRHSAKKNNASNSNATQHINVQIRQAGGHCSDEKVKKSCSSQSLMKIQATQNKEIGMEQRNNPGKLGAKKSNEGLAP